ncbi:MAG: glycosyltransferase [Verrucomicrobia bacterium]|nr:glycosyltransferase [Verrucomicrobiota bacterium]
MRIVVLGLSLTSSWGNGHATTYRGLLRTLARSGHDILFLERDQPWYADNRDMPQPDFCETSIYHSLAELKGNFAREIAHADFVMLGSFVPEGIAIARWITRIADGVTAFYDIDTPVTLSNLARGDCDYISADVIPVFDLYLSFTGGPTLRRIERQYGAQRARALYCSVDPDAYFPEPPAKKWLLGYLGTYSDDRQPALRRLLMDVAETMPGEHFVVAGPQYPEQISWPANVQRTQHLEPALHRSFYNSQRFTLNITRAAMVTAGWSPSVRLFEAAACAVPIISDEWPGLPDFFAPGREIFTASSGDDVLAILRSTPAETAAAVGHRARERVLADHTAAHRAAELEQMIACVAAGDVARKLEGVPS